MDPTTKGMIVFAIALILIALWAPIGFALAGLAIVCTFLFYGYRYSDTFQMPKAVRPTISLIYNNLFEFLHT